MLSTFYIPFCENYDDWLNKLKMMSTKKKKIKKKDEFNEIKRFLN